MLPHDFKQFTSIVEVINKLENPDLIFHEVLGLIYALGDKNIGKDNRGKYIDYHQIDRRIIKLIYCANMKGQGGKVITSSGWEVRKKARRALCSLLDYDFLNSYRPAANGLIIELLKFFSDWENIPEHEPDRRRVKEFLLAVYAGVMDADLILAVPKPFSHLRISPGFDTIHQLCIVPLAMIGQTEAFLKTLDYKVIPKLEKYALGHLGEGDPYYFKLEDVLVKEGKYNTKNMLSAALTVITLKAMLAEKERQVQESN